MPKTILIAASDPNIIYLLQRYAEASGFQTVSAGQGEELLQVARQTHPDLIVLEIEIPETTARKAFTTVEVRSRDQRYSGGGLFVLWRGGLRAGGRCGNLFAKICDVW